MARTGQILLHWQSGHVLHKPSHFVCFFSSSPPVQACSSGDSKSPCQGRKNTDGQSAGKAAATTNSSLSAWKHEFWSCQSTWKQAGINTLHCLVGCTIGDFSALWMLQTFYPELGMGTIMMASMASGITTSVFLKTTLLRRGADQLSWPVAAHTAMGMSMVSMVAMEAAENIVDYHLTGGVVALGDPQFWMAAVLSMSAGFLAPLPYNYLRLRKYGKACH